MFDLLGNYLSTLLQWPSTQASRSHSFQVKNWVRPFCAICSLSSYQGYLEFQTEIADMTNAESDQ